METKGNIVCFLQSFNFVFIIQEFKLNLNVSSSTSATNWTDVTIPEHTHIQIHTERRRLLPHPACPQVNFLSDLWHFFLSFTLHFLSYTNTHPYRLRASCGTDRRSHCFLCFTEQLINGCYLQPLYNGLCCLYLQTKQWPRIVCLFPFFF